MLSFPTTLSGLMYPAKATGCGEASGQARLSLGPRFRIPHEQSTSRFTRSWRSWRSRPAWFRRGWFLPAPGIVLRVRSMPDGVEAVFSRVERMFNTRHRPLSHRPWTLCPSFLRSTLPSTGSSPPLAFSRPECTLRHRHICPVPRTIFPTQNQHTNPASAFLLQATGYQSTRGKRSPRMGSMVSSSRVFRRGNSPNWVRGCASG